MKDLVDSSDRKPGEYVAFAMCAWGGIITAAGVLLTTPCVWIFGTIVVLVGSLYLLATEKE